MLGLVVVVVLVYAGYQLGQKQAAILSTPTPTPNLVPLPLQDETPNWKTYVSTKYKFSINYPSDWMASPADADEVFFGPQQSEGIPVGISIFSNNLSTSLNKRDEELKKSGYTTKIEDYNNNYLGGKKLIFNLDNNERFDFFTEKNGKTYQLVGASGEFYTIVSKMLSTFKFLD